MAQLTLTDLRTRVRRLIREDTAQLFTDQEVTDFLNEGIRDFSSAVLWYQRLVAMAIVANQFEYALPADIIKLEMARYQEQYRLYTADVTEWASITFRQSPMRTGTPLEVVYLAPHDKRLSVYPVPTAASPATTVSGALASGATTILCASTTTFPSAGYLLITTAGVTEQVRYFAKNATNFLQCRRGDGDTVAAAHNNLDPISSGEVTLLTRALPPDLSAGADIPKLPDMYIHAIVKYAAHLGYYKRLMFNEGRVHLADYINIRDEATRNQETADMDLTGGVKDYETETGLYGTP